MKWYRIVDSWWEPYHSGYNSTSLYEIAECICSLADWDWALEDDPAYTTNNIYRALLNGERDFIFLVEEQDEPFANHWYDEDDDEWIWEEGKEICIRRNYSSRVIEEYARTRKDLWTYSMDTLIDFVWDYSKRKDNWDIENLSKIVSEFVVSKAVKKCYRYVG